MFRALIQSRKFVNVTVPPGPEPVIAVPELAVEQVAASKVIPNPLGSIAIGEVAELKPLIVVAGASNPEIVKSLAAPFDPAIDKTELPPDEVIAADIPKP
jgi:hypothetical protein